MPIYDYVCEECGKEEEVFAFITEPPPTCHEKPMKKLLGPFMIRKGGGLYSMDKPEAKTMGDLE